MIYNAPKSAQDKCKDMSPDEMSKMMEAWMKWVKNCGEHLVDMGSMLSNSNILIQQVLHQVALRYVDTPSCKQIT